MKRTCVLVALACAAILAAWTVLAGCGEGVNSPRNGPVRDLTEDEALLVESDNRFGIKLFKKIVEAEGDKNVFVSPLSVSMALGMTFNGAAGTTEEAMRDVLELGDLTNEEINRSYKSLIELLTGLDPSVQFSIANSIWYRQDFNFKQTFLDLNRAYFDAEVTGLDFAAPGAAGIINAWVNRETKGKISEIVDDPIDPLNIMFLINAIYFKGAWTYQFDPEETSDDLFTLPDGSQRPCRMMAQEDTLRYQVTADFQAVDLPYGDGDFRMVVFLPAAGMKVDELAGMLNQEKWDQWLQGFSTRKVILAMPKFTLEYEIALNDVLSALGMGIAFEPTGADFTELYEGLQNAFLNKVKHKTYVKVDEEGTEAAAVTSVGVGAVGMPPVIRLNRPFLFAIRDNHSNTILFIGKIVEPALD